MEKNLNISSTSNSSSTTTPQLFQGQLSKFTNVVKGWQYRLFLLDDDKGTLEYYYSLENPRGKPRSVQRLAGSQVLPSGEDSNTFNVVFESGEVFKLRASSAKERQIWVDRIRTISQKHENDHIPVSVPIDKETDQRLPTSLIQDFGSLNEHFSQLEIKMNRVCKDIEDLPIKGLPPLCISEDLLLLKATSHAAVHSLEQGFQILQDFKELNSGTVSQTFLSGTPSSQSRTPLKKLKKNWQNKQHCDN